jgi:tetratricopeptide (TPR) repeat protein
MVDVKGLSLDVLVDSGVMAYKNREFADAMKNLEQVLDIEPRHWRAKLYLAMSYYHTGEVFAAYRHFTYLKDNCTDPDIRQKAESAMAALNDAMKPKNTGMTITSRMPEMTCTMKKPTAPPKDLEIDESNPDIEWVSTKVE